MSGSEGTVDISKLTQAVEELIRAVKAHVEVTTTTSVPVAPSSQDAVQQLKSQETQLDALNHKLSSLDESVRGVNDNLFEISKNIALQTKHQRLDWAFDRRGPGRGFLLSDTSFLNILTAFRRNRGYCITYLVTNAHGGKNEEFRAKITDHLDGLLGTTTRLEHADGEWMIYYE